jgi:phosphoribosylamine-glycine ligase
LKNNKFQSTGGRILTVNAYSGTKESALAAAYENIKKIKIYEDEDMKVQNQDLVFYREDIGN